jgi:hypothetical protein
MRFVAVIVCALLSTSFAHAKDDLRLFSISDALGTHEGKTELDPAVKLYFADQPHPKVEKTLGTWVTNKKFPVLNKPPKSVCEYTFIDALKELQRRALKEGGNAVVGIESYYKKMIRSSTDKYMCGVGYVAIGVALRGTVIKVNEDEIK